MDNEAPVLLTKLDDKNAVMVVSSLSSSSLSPSLCYSPSASSSSLSSIHSNHDENTTSTTTTNNDIITLFMGDKNRYRPAIRELECYETVKEDDDLGSMIVFHCKTNVKRNNNPEQENERSSSTAELQFDCRDSSVGVLIPEFGEQYVSPDQKVQGRVDHNFFDKGYTLLGSTGFQIWPGTRLMTEALCWPILGGSSINSSMPSPTNRSGASTTSTKIIGYQEDCPKLQALQQQIRSHARVLEIGAGIGVVGVALASMGAHVLQTDLPTLTDNAIWPNQVLNQTSRSSNNTIDDHNDDDGTNTEFSTAVTTTTTKATTCPVFLQPYEEYAVPIDHGWAAATSLDWTKPLDEQVSETVLSQIDLIVGCGCLNLKQLEEALLSGVIERIFELSPSAKFVMTYQRRGRNSMFTTVESILESFRARQWQYDCLAWRTINCAQDGDAPEDGENDLFLFEVTPLPAAIAAKTTRTNIAPVVFGQPPQ